MSDLFNSAAPLSSDISMILQLLALGLIIVGFFIVKRRSFKVHGALMAVAALMNTASILVVMIPTALRLVDTSIPNLNTLFRSHILLGVVVEGIALYLVIDWRFQNPGPTCFQRKNWMLGLSIAWIAEVMLGMLLYMKMYL